MTRTPTPDPAPKVAAELEKEYVIGPALARELDYQIDWQYSDLRDPVADLWVQGDSVFLLDHRNSLTRVDREGGSRAWRLPVAGAVDQIIGVTYLPEINRVYVTTGGNIFGLDSVSGSQVAKQRLVKMANTSPAVFGPYLIYGSRNGQAIWHAYGPGVQWRGYQVANSIHIPPVLTGNTVVVIGSNGTIMAIHAETVQQLWSKTLRDEVVAPAAVSQDAVYVAGTDQNLRAIDLGSGRSMWAKLFDQPLYDAPTVIGDRVYQHVPTHGLGCFDAIADNQPGGVELWMADGLEANVITQHKDTLLAWNARDRRMTLLNNKRGSVVKTVDLPQVARLLCTAAENGELFAVASDGRVSRLVPR